MAVANLPKAILVVDDDSTVGQAIEAPLNRQYNVEVSNSQDLDTSIYFFKNQDFDVVFVELEFEPLHGLALIQRLRDSDSLDKRATAFVLMSGKTRSPSDDNLLKELLDIEVIQKPFSMVHVLPYLSRGMAMKKKLLKHEAFRAECLKLVAAGRTKEAVEHAKSHLAPLDGRAVKLICEIFERGNLLEEGLAFISPLSEKDPGSIIYTYLRGRFLRLLGRFKDARRFLEDSNKQSPNNLRRLDDMGELYLGLNDVEKAVENLRTLVKLSPESEAIKFYWFERLDDAGYTDEARKFCQQTTKPMEVVRFYNNKGVEMSKLGDHRGAIAQYQKAIKLYPNFKENYRLHYNIALAYIKLKNIPAYEAAAEALKAALQLKPEFDKARTTLEVVNKTLDKKVS